ncbi:hypothetical protein FRC07_006379 [Ceratobasidium sp. 392]|nr:hypothetical protein FRC07_006379 [Ceratobasidium sp. 392]
MTAQPKPARESLLDPPGNLPSIVLLQHDLAASCASVLQQIVEDALASQVQVIFTCLSLPPSKYVEATASENLHLCDFSGLVPGYSDDELDLPSEIQARVSSIGNAPILLVIDSPDTLLADLGSQSRTLDALSRAFGHIIHQSKSSRLVLPIRSNSSLIPSLLSTAFQARVPRTAGSQLPQTHTLTQLIFHPPILLSHLVQHYHVSLPPVNTPPESSSARFWSVFAPVAGRRTGEQLVMGTDNDQLSGSTSPNDPSTSRDSNIGVIELIARARIGGQKGLRRVLRGWRADKAQGRVVWCGWEDILMLKSRIAGDTGASASASNGIDSVSFNLQLSDAQQQARANVPLPYVNDGLQAYGSAKDGEIHYIPDQADDFDDDDPDDDLYI